MIETGLILIVSGVALTVVGVATSGLELDLEAIKTIIRVSRLTASKALRLVPLVLGVVLVLAGVLVLVIPTIRGPDDGGSGPDDGGSGPDRARAIVVAPGGGSTATSYSGPSTQGYVVADTIVANTAVTVLCTAYGQSLHFGAVDVNLWNYTDHGWLNDHYLSTGVPGPIANGCAGTVGEPRVGKSPPTRATGPYAVIADEGVSVDVRTEPNRSAKVTASLGAGTLVRMSCTMTGGPTIPAPRALGSASSNNVWDRVVDPAGWIPDSYVATYSLEPVAPACSGT